MSEILLVGAHTEGPWEAFPETDNQSAHVSVVQTGNILAEVYGADEIKATANAYLIAVAPDLLWVLKRILDDLPTKRDWLNPDLERIAHEAIARAEDIDTDRQAANGKGKK